MTMILPIGLGVLGFALMAGADWAGYKQIPVLKPLLWISNFPVSTIAVVLAWTNENYFFPPVILSIIGWIGFPFFILLFLYSLFIEIPLRKTYIDPDHPTKLVTDGTYSLCRHPAFLWFLGWIITAVLISQSVTLAIAAPIWIVSYIGFLFLEEKICCIETFADEYRQYQQTTPMLIPTVNSMKNFLVDIRSELSLLSSRIMNNEKELK